MESEQNRYDICDRVWEKGTLRAECTFELYAIIGTEFNFVELLVNIPKGSMIP